MYFPISRAKTSSGEKAKLLGFFLRNLAVYVALLKSLSEGILVKFPPKEFRFNVFFTSE